MFDCSGVVLVLLAVLHLTGDKLETLRKDGEILPAEAFEAVGFGHCQSHQMTESPCNGVAVTFHVSVLALFSAHNEGNIPCHTRFLCNNDFHNFTFLGFTFL